LSPELDDPLIEVTSIHFDSRIDCKILAPGNIVLGLAATAVAAGVVGGSDPYLLK